MVVIPRLHGKRYCPVRCLIKYIKLRNQRIANKEVSDNLPLLLTEHLWRKGSSRADKNQVGFYTKSRFSKDVSAAIKLLAAHVPSVVGVMASLKSHSLRSGIPTALQKFKNLPESLKKSIGKKTITRVYPLKYELIYKYFRTLAFECEPSLPKEFGPG